MTVDAFERLRPLAKYRAGRMHLLRLSLFTIVFGTCLAAIAILRPAGVLPTFLYGGLAAVCFVTGWINCRHVAPVVLIIEATLLGIAGLGLVGFTGLVWFSLRVERGWMLEFLAAGVVSLGLATVGLIRARWAARLAAGRPAPEEVEWLDSITDHVSAGNPAEQTDAVAFTTREFGNSVYQWRGRFYGDEAVFVKRPGDGLFLARRDEVSVVVRGRVWLSQDQRVRLQVGRHKLRAVIGPSSLANLQAWSQSANKVV